MLSCLCDPQIHLCCDTWLYNGQHGSRTFYIHLLVDTCAYTCNVQNSVCNLKVYLTLPVLMSTPKFTFPGWKSTRPDRTCTVGHSFNRGIFLKFQLVHCGKWAENYSTLPVPRNNLLLAEAQMSSYSLQGVGISPCLTVFLVVNTGKRQDFHIYIQILETLNHYYPFWSKKNNSKYNITLKIIIGISISEDPYIDMWDNHSMS